MRNWVWLKTLKASARKLHIQMFFERLEVLIERHIEVDSRRVIQRVSA